MNLFKLLIRAYLSSRRCLQVGRYVCLDHTASQGVWYKHTLRALLSAIQSNCFYLQLSVCKQNIELDNNVRGEFDKGITHQQVPKLLSFYLKKCEQSFRIEESKNIYAARIVQKSVIMFTRAFILLYLFVMQMRQYITQFLHNPFLHISK